MFIFSLAQTNVCVASFRPFAASSRLMPYLETILENKCLSTRETAEPRHNDSPNQLCTTDEVAYFQARSSWVVRFNTLLNPASLSKLQLKFDVQIARNRIFKVLLFKVSQLIIFQTKKI